LSEAEANLARKSVTMPNGSAALVFMISSSG
jgi:hypothetical protein